LVIWLFGYSINQKEVWWCWACFSGWWYILPQSKVFFRKDINSMTWQTNSPDLSVSSNLWWTLTEMLHKKTPSCKANLSTAVQESWNLIVGECCLSLVKSIRNPSSQKRKRTWPFFFVCLFVVYTFSLLLHLKKKAKNEKEFIGMFLIMSYKAIRFRYKMKLFLSYLCLINFYFTK